MTWRGESADGSWLTQMLVVTSSVGMVDGVHSHSLDLGEVLLESGVLVVEGTSLDDWLLVLSSSADDSDGGSAVAGDGLSHS